MCRTERDVLRSIGMKDIKKIGIIKIECFIESNTNGYIPIYGIVKEYPFLRKVPWFLSLNPGTAEDPRTARSGL